MLPSDPFSLDRQLRVEAGRWERFRRELRRGQHESSFRTSLPFNKEMYDWASGLPLEFELRAPLLRWIYRLGEQQAHASELAHEARLLRVRRHAVQSPVEGQFTVAELTRAALKGPHQGKWHESRLRCSHELAAQRAELWQRRQEFAEKWGFADPDALEPLSPAARVAARTYLAETQEVVFAQVKPGLAAYVESALAREASAGWPGRMAKDTFVDLLGHKDWLWAVALDPGPLPARIAPASFLRALARVGAAWQVALASTHQSFVIARDPFGLRAWSEGALWALMVCQRPFLRRQLGLGSDQASAHQRTLLLAVGQWVRLLAVRCLARSAAFQGEKSFRDAAPELLMQLTGHELEHEQLLGMTRLRMDDPHRLLSWFLAAERYERLVEEHDEDWFRSPRAIEQLREEAKPYGMELPNQEALGRGRVLLQSWLVRGASS